MVGLPLTDTALAGHPPTVAGKVEEALPFTLVLVPLMFMLPLAPISPLVLTALFGGFAGVPSVLELKL